MNAPTSESLRAIKRGADEITLENLIQLLAEYSHLDLTGSNIVCPHRSFSFVHLIGKAVLAKNFAVGIPDFL
jgi:hypothetical protein